VEEEGLEKEESIPHPLRFPCKPKSVLN